MYFMSNSIFFQLRQAIEQCNAGTFRRPSKANLLPPSPPDIESADPNDDEKEKDVETSNKVEDELNSLDSAMDTEPETTDDESQRLN